MNKLVLRFSKSTIVKFLFFLLMITTVFMYGLDIQLPQILLIIIACSIVLIGNETELLAMVLCCIPLYICFEYMYIVLVASIVLLFKNIRKYKVNISVVILLTLLMWELLHGLDGDFALNSFVVMILPYAFVFLLQFYNGRKVDYKYLVSVFAICVISLGIMFIIETIIDSGGNVTYALSNINRLGLKSDTEVTWGVINPNSLGIICVLAISGVIQKMLYLGQNKLDVPLVVALLIIGFLTLSRTFIICLFIAVSLFTFGKKRTFKENLKIIGIFLIIVLICTIVFSAVFPGVYESFASRWQEADMSNGRLEIFEQSFNYIISNPSVLIWGIGQQNFAENARNLVEMPPHDAITELVMAWGIVGLALFVGYILSMIISAKKKNPNIMLANYIPLIIIIVKGFAGHLITSGYTMIALIFAYLSLEANFNDAYKDY